MSNVYTLDSIREAAEKKYGSFDIDLGNGEIVKLLNPLRISKENRKKLNGLQDRLDEESDNQEELLAESLRLVAENRSAVDGLLAIIGDDLTILAEIFEQYTAATQTGEASASQS